MCMSPYRCGLAWCHCWSVGIVIPNSIMGYAVKYPFIYLFVCKITEKLVDGLGWNVDIHTNKKTLDTQLRWEMFPKGQKF